MSIKISSRKAKGRFLQNKVRELLLEFNDNLEDGDIRTAIMGESGADIKFSPLADKIIPYSIECKNQESLNIWSALKQAESNTSDNKIPLVVFKRNRSQIYCALKFEDLLKVVFDIKKSIG